MCVLYLQRTIFEGSLVCESLVDRNRCHSSWLVQHLPGLGPFLLWLSWRGHRKGWVHAISLVFIFNFINSFIFLLNLCVYSDSRCTWLHMIWDGIAISGGIYGFLGDLIQRNLRNSWLILHMLVFLWGLQWLKTAFSVQVAVVSFVYLFLERLPHVCAQSRSSSSNVEPGINLVAMSSKLVSSDNNNNKPENHDISV